MQKTDKYGFTLIELLVVVIIIAVLAAVAVPQYKKAVLKSRFSSLYPIAQPLAQGQESYYLNQGEYAEDFAALDVSLPGMASGKTASLQNGTQVKLGVEDNHIYVRAEKGNNALMIYQNHSPNFAGETHCEALIEDDLANWLCDKGLDGNFVGNKFGYAIYSLSEKTVGNLARTYYGKTDWQGHFPYSISDGDECRGNEIYSCRKGTLTHSVCTAVGNYVCRDSSFTENSECVATSSTSYSCDGTFNHSTCTSENPGNCTGTFTNYSKCVGQKGSCTGHFEDHSQCISPGGCSNSSYDNYSSSEGSGSGSSYSNHSVCYGTGYWTCADYNGKRSSYTEHSSCEGNVGTSCFKGDYTNHSVCYANVQSTCYGNTYDQTSYCAGSYCPAGTPAGDTDGIFAGKCWDGSGNYGAEYCPQS